MMESPMPNQPFDHLDRSPAESDPELADVVALLNKLGSSDRSEFADSLNASIAQASVAQLGTALEPLTIAPSHSVFRMRIAAAIAVGGLSLAAWIAGTSLNQSGTQIADTGKTTTTQPDAPITTTVTPTMLASAQTASDWAAVSSLFEDTLGSDIDILSAEVSRLGSSLKDAAEISPAASDEAGGKL